MLSSTTCSLNAEDSGDAQTLASSSVSLDGSAANAADWLASYRAIGNWETSTPNESGRRLDSVQCARTDCATKPYDCALTALNHIGRERKRDLALDLQVPSRRSH